MEQAEQRTKKLRENYDQWGWLGGYEDVVDRIRQPGKELYAPMSTVNDRRYGHNWPFWRTWQEHARLRASARLLCQLSPVATGALYGLQAFVIGNGYTYRTHSEQNAPTGLIDAVQSVIDEFVDDLNWCSLEQEIFTRSRRDGESFVLHQPRGKRLHAEIIEPEQVYPPPGESEEDWSYGIETNGRATHIPLSYAVSDEPGEQPDIYTADELTHIKVNVDAKIKRGLSDFCYDTHDAIRTAGRLVDHVGQGAAIQASIALIRQHQTASPSQVQDFMTAASDYDRYDPISGQQEYSERFTPGKILDIDAGQEYVVPPFSTNVGGYIQVIQGILRTVAVRWNAPEWLISADASNTNYASSVTAESPFVKRCYQEQERYKKFFLKSIWAAIKHAAKSGRIRAYGRTWDWQEVRKLVDVQVEAPNVEVRDDYKTAQMDNLYLQMGIKSPQTIGQSLGLDVMREASNFKAWKSAGPSASGEGGSNPDDPTAALRGSVGGSQALMGIQQAYYQGVLPREACIANARIVYGFTQEDAELLFPVVQPTKLNPEQVGEEQGGGGGGGDEPPPDQPPDQGPPPDQGGGGSTIEDLMGDLSPDLDRPETGLTEAEQHKDKRGHTYCTEKGEGRVSCGDNQKPLKSKTSPLSKTRSAPDSPSGGKGGDAPAPHAGELTDAIERISKDDIGDDWSTITRQDAQQKLRDMATDPHRLRKTGTRVLARLTEAGKKLIAGGGAVMQAIYDKGGPVVRQVADVGHGLGVGMLALWGYIEHSLESFKHGMHALALQVAHERGIPQEHAEKAVKTCSTIDAIAAWTVNIPLTHEYLHQQHHIDGWAGFALAKIGYFIPVASIAYCAYSTMRNPLAMARAAYKVISSHGKSERHTESRIKFLFGDDLVSAVADRIKSAGDHSDWWMCLFCAAFDRVRDSQQAIAEADAAFRNVGAMPDGDDEASGVDVVKWLQGHLGDSLAKAQSSNSNSDSATESIELDDIRRLEESLLRGDDMTENELTEARVMVRSTWAVLNDLSRRLTEAKKAGPKEGDVNAKGLVFKNKRWRRPTAEDGPVKTPAKKATASKTTGKSSVAGATLTQHLRDALTGDADKVAENLAKIAEHIKSMSPEDKAAVVASLEQVLSGKEPEPEPEQKQPEFAEVGSAIKELKARTGSSVAKIPELFDALKKDHPDLSREQFEALIQKLHDEDKITLEVANSGDGEKRAGEGIKTKRGLGFYVHLNEDPETDKPAAQPAKEAPAKTPAKRQPAEKKKKPEKGDVNEKGKVYDGRWWRRPPGEKPAPKPRAKKAAAEQPEQQG